MQYTIKRLYTINKTINLNYSIIIWQLSRYRRSKFMVISNFSYREQKRRKNCVTDMQSNICRFKFWKRACFYGGGNRLWKKCSFGILIYLLRDTSSSALKYYNLLNIFEYFALVNKLQKEIFNIVVESCFYTSIVFSTKYTYNIICLILVTPYVWVFTVIMDQTICLGI